MNVIARWRTVMNVSAPRPLVVIVLLAASAGQAHGDEDTREGARDTRDARDGDHDDGDDSAAEELVAVVRVAGDDDAAVLERIEGQTSDLDVVLRIDRADRGNARAEADIADQLSTARALSRRYDARVV